jgi:hypothetical protein
MQMCLKTFTYSKLLFHIKFTKLVMGKTFSEPIYRTVWWWEPMLDAILHVKITLIIHGSAVLFMQTESFKILQAPP